MISPRHLIAAVRKRTSGLMHAMGVLALMVLALPAQAVDTNSFTLSGSAASAAGAPMASAIGSSILAWAQVIRGPGVVVCLVAGMVFALWGWFGQRKEMLWVGLGGFALAAIFGSLFIFV